jgi:hypothetical protein
VTATRMSPALPDSVEALLNLGLFEKAWAELDRLEPAAMAYEDVQRLRIHLLAAHHCWEDATKLSVSNGGATDCDGYASKVRELLEVSRYPRHLPEAK